MPLRSRSGEPREAGAAGVGLDLRAPPAPGDIRDALVIKEGDAFLVSDLAGNVPVGNPDGLGLYLEDTRYLSGFELIVQGLTPTVLLAVAQPHFFGAHVLTNPNLVAADGRAVPEQTVQIRRYRVIRWDELTESLTFESFNLFPLTLAVEVRVQADFLDVFEIRGLAQRAERGRLHEAALEPARATFTYDGQDALRREAVLGFDPPPATLRTVEGPGGGAPALTVATYDVALEARGAARITLHLRIHRAEPGASSAAPARRPRLRLPAQAGVHTSDSRLDTALERARLDLQLLLSGDEQAPYLAAGIPWYATLFGRDSIITALLCVWIAPDLAKQTLTLLARHQGTREDPWRDEQPGKVMHELRRGELARLDAVPFTPYFGTVDATPLWVVLLAAYHRASGDLELVRALRSHLDAALGWIERSMAGGAGFLAYRRRSEGGLVNQGWKDSWDAIAHTDGALAEAPIALVEAQAYVYAAWRGASALLRLLGEPERAAALERAAAALGAAFADAFWMPGEGFYCLALDGRGRQVASIASNAGHALWCGIAPPEQADRVAARLLDEDLFSGWGVRTLSNRELRYNPAGYHVGSVWPHDNALIALGLKRYGHAGAVTALVTGMRDAAGFFPGFSMPELFCGFARTAFAAPVRYPVACRPQAWAAACWSGFLQAVLGLQLDSPACELRIVRPSLPAWLNEVSLTGLRFGRGSVDLHYRRAGGHTAVDVSSLRGGVRVVYTETWDVTLG